MAEQKKKSTTPKVATVRTRTPKAAVTPAANKAASRKTAAAVSAPEKSKSPAVQKASAAASKAAKSPTKKAATSKAKSPAGNRAAVKPTPEERYRMVETAAYFIAEQHGFQGRSDEHWAAAERAIEAKLGK